MENLKPVIASSALGLASLAYLNSRYGISRDIKQISNDRRFGTAVQARCRALGNVASLYGHFVLADADAEALWFEDRTWTYAEALQRADGLAEILAARGVCAGSFVAVFMTNSPEMLFTILAISKIGAVPALVNTALRNETLLHCLSVAQFSLAVSTPDLIEHLIVFRSDASIIKEIITLNVGSFDVHAPESSQKFDRISQDDLDSAAVSLKAAPRALKDIGVLIYTSGTSGKPKAVSIKNFQFALVSTPLPIDLANPKRYRPLRIFSCLPLFHATCLFTGVLYAAGSSGTFCLARKFSASGFCRSLVQSRATRMLYVGELCRYLLKSAPSPFDRAHNCRVASGNGLQKDIWIPFMDRFGIREIREFYRSTEGLARFDNFSSGVASAGKIGFQGPVARPFNKHTYLVKYDQETGAPWRHPKTGFCVPVKAGEPGEAIGRVVSMDFYSDYLNNAKATEEKLLANVFCKGDLFQRTGDLLVREPSGWIRFLDRTGDTYRWRGENVSAGEVREHISHLPSVQDVTVHAVRLNGYDGQAGAAAITLADPSRHSSFADQLHSRLKARGLTVYQVPRLVRFLPAIEVNATFKHAKTEMTKKSWDPASQPPGETVYWLNGEKYQRLNQGSWEDIANGRSRL